MEENANEPFSGNLPDDIIRHVEALFSTSDRSIALTLLSGSVMHDGKLADDRLRGAHWWPRRGLWRSWRTTLDCWRLIIEMSSSPESVK